MSHAGGSDAERGVWAECWLVIRCTRRHCRQRAGEDAGGDAMTLFLVGLSLGACFGLVVGAILAVGGRGEA